MRYKANITLEGAARICILKIRTKPFKRVLIEYHTAGAQSKQKWFAIEDVLVLSPSWEYEQTA